MSIINLSVSKRKSKESSSKNLQIQGEIPAIFYSKSSPSIPIKLDLKQMRTLLSSPVGLIKLNIDNGETYMAIAKEVQRDPVSKKPIHLSFEGIKEGEYFHINLPVRIEHSDDCRWVKDKGIAVQKATTLSVEVLPKQLPEGIVINIDHLNVGDILHISDLKFPHLKFLDHSQTEVVSITYATMTEEPEPQATLSENDTLEETKTEVTENDR